MGRDTYIILQQRLQITLVNVEGALRLTMVELEDKVLRTGSPSSLND